MGWIYAASRRSGRLTPVDADDEEYPINAFACEAEIRAFAIRCPTEGRTRSGCEMGARPSLIVGSNASGAVAVILQRPFASPLIAAWRPKSRNETPRGNRVLAAVPCATLKGGWHAWHSERRCAIGTRWHSLGTGTPRD